MSSYSERFDRAVALAVRDFRGITRKGSHVPYITHLFSVTSRVGEAGGDEDQLIAAMLHDWLEDVPGSSAEHLAQEFGDRVARLVVALSDTTVRPKPPWAVRKLQYLARLREEPPEVKLISCCDKWHNAETLWRDLRREGEATLARFAGGRDGTLWYYAAVAAALAERWQAPVLDELHRVVAAIHEEVGEVVGEVPEPVVESASARRGP